MDLNLEWAVGRHQRMSVQANPYFNLELLAAWANNFNLVMGLSPPARRPSCLCVRERPMAPRGRAGGGDGLLQVDVRRAFAVCVLRRMWRG